MRQILTTAFLCCIAFSAAALDSHDLFVHMGVDAQWRYIPLKKGFGDNLTKKNYEQTGVYGGVRFLEDNLGFEVGYQRSISRSQNTDITNTSSYFTSTLPNTGTYVSSTKVAMQNFYASVVGLIPLSEIVPFKLLVSVGAGRTRMQIAANLSPTTGATVGTAWPLNFKAIKWIPKAGLGFQYMMSQHFGLRTLASWEKTSQFKQIRAATADGSANNKYFASFKNGASLGLGLFYRF